MFNYPFRNAHCPRMCPDGLCLVTHARPSTRLSGTGDDCSGDGGALITHICWKTTRHFCTFVHVNAKIFILSYVSNTFALIAMFQIFLCCLFALLSSETQRCPWRTNINVWCIVNTIYKKANIRHGNIWNMINTVVLLNTLMHQDLTCRTFMNYITIAYLPGKSVPACKSFILNGVQKHQRVFQNTSMAVTNSVDSTL